jgi:hypothetical protein
MLPVLLFKLIIILKHTVFFSSLQGDLCFNPRARMRAIGCVAVCLRTAAATSKRSFVVFCKFS